MVDIHNFSNIHEFRVGLFFDHPSLMRAFSPATTSSIFSAVPEVRVLVIFLFQKHMASENICIMFPCPKMIHKKRIYLFEVKSVSHVHHLSTVISSSYLYSGVTVSHALKVNFMNGFLIILKINLGCFQLSVYGNGTYFFFNVLSLGII